MSTELVRIAEELHAIACKQDLYTEDLEEIVRLRDRLNAVIGVLAS